MQTPSRGSCDRPAHVILGFPGLQKAWHPLVTHPLCHLWKEPAWAEPSCDLELLCGAQFPSSEEGVVLTGLTTEQGGGGWSRRKRLWKAAGSCSPASVLCLPPCPSSHQDTPLCPDTPSLQPPTPIPFQLLHLLTAELLTGSGSAQSLPPRVTPHPLECLLLSPPTMLGLWATCQIGSGPS